MARGRKGAADAGPVEGLWELPEGWSWERLENVAPVNPGRDLGRVEDNDEVTFLPMAAVAELSGEIDLRQRRKVGAVRSGFTRFRTGDLIFAKITPCMENGKLAVIPDIPLGVGAGSTEFHVLEPQQVSGKYLFYWMSQQTFRDRAERNMQGASGQRRVPADWLRSSPVPIPPSRSVQEDVVGCIDRLFAEIDEGESSLADARAGVETYRKSLLKAAVTGELTADWRRQNSPRETGAELLQRIVSDMGNHAASGRRKTKAPPADLSSDLSALTWTIPSEWQWVPLGALSFVTKLAGFEYTDYVKYADDGDMPVIKAENAGPDGFRSTNFSRVHSSGVRELTRSQLHGGELLMVFVGAGTGNVATVPRDRQYFLGPNIAMMRIGTQAVVPRYVELFLRSVGGKALALSFAKAVAQPSLSMGAIRQIPIAVPPLEEQQVILERLEAGLEASEGMGGARALERWTTTKLRQSILAAAFRGELT